MKYLLLIYESPGTREVALGEGGEALMAQVSALLEEVTERGELVATHALADPANAKSVRAQGGAPVVTDGPFAEAKEHLGGFLLLDCDEERALDIARRWPKPGSGGMEVRPIMEAGGAEM